MDDKLKKEILAEVDKIFAGKKEDEQRKRTEVALEESASAIEALASDLESEKVQVNDLKDKLVASEEVVKTLEEEKEVASVKLEKATEEKVAEIESVTKELKEKSEELDTIKKDAVAATRMEELTSGGVVRSDKAEQMAKVREMSDETFASYKEELVEVRSSILAELKKAADKTEENKEEGSEQEEGSDDGVVTPPANIDPGTAVSAAMNMEIYPSDDIVAQYADMGKAMAEAMTKEK
jgi:chromosome segregation ATPase